MYINSIFFIKPNISIDLESAGKSTLKVVAIGANGLVSKTVLKTI